MFKLILLSIIIIGSCFGVGVLLYFADRYEEEFEKQQKKDIKESAKVRTVDYRAICKACNSCSADYKNCARCGIRVLKENELNELG